LSLPLAEPQVRHELQSASGADPGSLLERLEAALRAAPDERRLALVPAGLRVSVAPVDPLVDRLTAPAPRPRLRPQRPSEVDRWLPIVASGASAATPRSTHDEELLRWALREVVRIESLTARGEVD